MQEIICILDGSGSMGLVGEEACNGFNRFLADQKALGEANLTVVWFDNIWRIAYEGPLSEAAPVAMWEVGGMTALYDAVGGVITHVGDRFAVEKPERVILAIQTDGMENASRSFSAEAVKSLIELHENVYGWSVLYLGAGLKSKAQAGDMGIRVSNTMTYDVNDTENAFKKTYSGAVASARVK
jgi:hypothetical protein